MTEHATRPAAVDVHNHFIPPELVGDARRGGGFDGVTVERRDGRDWMVHRQGFAYPLHASFHDLSARLEAMDALEIDRAVMSISPTTFFYWADASGTVDFCRLANDSMAKFARASGGRIHPVAALPMQDPPAAAAELDRAVTELGMFGAQIGPVIEDTPLDDASMAPVLETAQRLDVPLILHPYYVGSKPGLEDFYLTNLVGNPLDTVVAAARLIFSGTLDRLDRLQLVLMHGGGYLPYQVGRLDHGHRVRGESKGCAQPPSSYLRRFTYDTITHAPAPLRFLIDQVGADRVAYGTDLPYDMAGGSFTDQTTGAELDAAETALVARGNTERLFRLPAPPG